MKLLFKFIPLLSTLLFCACTNTEIEELTAYLASPSLTVRSYSLNSDKNLIADEVFVRGMEITLFKGASIKVDKTVFEKVRVGKKTLFIEQCFVTQDFTACAQEKSVFVRTPASIISDTLKSSIAALADKTEELSVLGYDKMDASGKVRRYYVSNGSEKGYIYGKYTVLDAASASERYLPEKYDAKHSLVKDSFGAGSPLGCDYFPVEKPVFPDNPMPDPVCAFYMTISPLNLNNIDSYIALAKTTHINAFVIDIKDDACPGYKADAMAEFSPTSYGNAGSRKEKQYADAIRKLKENGFYVVGRITCFKDQYFVKDNPSTAITEIETGKPFYHNKSYWPSAYDRRVWEYNVALAKESVRKFGLNEINFDYVRFPDRMNSVENRIDYHNRYSESKVQAIQRFVQYACDELHELGVYVTIDVFGETANPGYTTAYGQYWPALSNLVDAMCGMPYPDHFADHYYGISKPWNHPYQILNAWGQRVMAQQEATTTPARVRTWVQCYHVMKHVDPNGIDYNAENVEKEIRGLIDAGLVNGYVTWLSSANLERYRAISDAFRVDYW